MPREPEAGMPVEWLRRARSNLIRAKQPKPEEVFWEDLCFDAQQAAEKALKGLLIFYGIPFRFVHDIAELLTRLEQGGITLPEDIRLSAAGSATRAVTPTRRIWAGSSFRWNELRRSLRRTKALRQVAIPFVEQSKAPGRGLR